MKLYNDLSNDNTQNSLQEIYRSDKIEKKSVEYKVPPPLNLVGTKRG